MRAGIYAGSVVKRGGDVFGSTVNTAARLAAIARPGQIVGNAEAAAALQGVDRLAVTPLGPLRLRNVGAFVEAFALDVGTRHQEHVDPICRMHVTTDAESLMIVHQEGTYRFYFCSTACLSQFAERVGNVGTSSGDGGPETIQSFVGEVAAHFGTPVPSPAGGNAASTSTSSICS
ncbi:hypothetical protein [Mycolicibacterium arabiense]|uniref:hypothetical protein n=1 Tax=Mycolicibacterium arabiense TaxID=1286181 RepID=UPI001F1E6AD3|nr:hypothetical protein [Mycolicibacterium arabiense]